MVKDIYIDDIYTYHISDSTNLPKPFPFAGKVKNLIGDENTGNLIETNAEIEVKVEERKSVLTMFCCASHHALPCRHGISCMQCGVFGLFVGVRGPISVCFF